MPLLFFIFWIVLNGRFTWDVLLTGVFATLLVTVFTYKLLGIDFAREKKVWRRLGRIVPYFFLLIVEVVKANIHMIQTILASVIEIRPQIVYFKSPVRSDGSKIALASSITLTPGTITIKLEGDDFGVHALDESFAEGVDASAFVKRLKKIEGGH